MFRLLLIGVTRLADLLFLLQTFVPVLKRQWSWDARHDLHFTVFWTWLGFEFFKDDVVVKHDKKVRVSRPVERDEGWEEVQ